MSKETGGPAFPTLGNVSHNAVWITEDGMTIRDYFAGQALQGIMLGSRPYRSDFDQNAHDAWAQADAMLAHRNREAGDAN